MVSVKGNGKRSGMWLGFDISGGGGASNGIQEGRTVFGKGGSESGRDLASS